eukprot:scaffold35107_cov70-Phaeocystis_antarctica.AAC.4
MHPTFNELVAKGCMEPRCRRSPVTGPEVKSGGGGGAACRFNLKSGDSTATPADVAESLGGAVPPPACRLGDAPLPPGSAMKAPSEDSRPCSPPSPPPPCAAPLTPLAAPSHAWRASRGGGGSQRGPRGRRQPAVGGCR